MRPPRFVLLGLLVPSLVAATAPAAAVAASPAPRPPVPGTCVEGFDGTFPPSGWHVQRSNLLETWKQAGNGHTGSCALVDYDSTPGAQDEYLVLPLVDYHGPLVVWTRGNATWCRDTYDNCDLELWWFRLGTDSVLLHTFDSAWAGIEDWVQVTLDLAALPLPPGLGHLAFRYHGLDGDQASLDDVEFPHGCPLFGSDFERGDPCDWDAIQPPCGFPPEPQPAPAGGPHRSATIAP
jgi:hypothetical protein